MIAMKTPKAVTTCKPACRRMKRKQAPDRDPSMGRLADNAFAPRMSSASSDAPGEAIEASADGKAARKQQRAPRFRRATSAAAAMFLAHCTEERSTVIQTIALLNRVFNMLDMAFGEAYARDRSTTSTPSCRRCFATRRWKA